MRRRLSLCAENYCFLGTNAPGDEADMDPIVKGRCTFVFHSVSYGWKFIMLKQAQKGKCEK